ncbi:hypothetical protein XM74_c10250 [Vibrio vulnificus]|nr:hypothetical protein XM74_c10250 [Vibrio vulnificus]
MIIALVSRDLSIIRWEKLWTYQTFKKAIIFR